MAESGNVVNPNLGTAPPVPSGPPRPKYSMLGEDVCLPSHLESRKEFVTFRNAIHEAYPPMDAFEGMLLDCVISAVWRKRRTSRLEREAWVGTSSTPAGIPSQPVKIGPIISAEGDIKRLQENGTVDFMKWLDSREAHLDQSVQRAQRNLREYRELCEQRMTQNDETVDEVTTDESASPGS